MNTNLKVRVIPTILIKGYQIVKSRKFEDYRIVGNLEQTIEVFNRRNVDEIIIYDIDASKKKSGVNLELLKLISRNSLMPLTYGGGITSIKEIENCLALGCDKVSLNSIALNNPGFVSKAVNIFGSQAIVGAIDYIVIEGKERVYSHAKNEALNTTLEDFFYTLIDTRIGEIVLTSVDHDGTLSGYDLSVLDRIAASCSNPILVNGGCGHPNDMVQAFNNNAAGCCAGSIFYYTEYSYLDIKKHAYVNNINVRLL